MYTVQTSTHGHDAPVKLPVLDEEDSDQIDVSGFSGNLRRDDRDNTRDCWRMSDGNNFRVRSKTFIYDKSKVVIFPRNTVESFWLLCRLSYLFCLTIYS
jgi:hypothetical protein